MCVGGRIPRLGDLPWAPQLCFSSDLEPARSLGLCDPGLMGRSREAGGHSRCPFCSPGSKVAGLAWVGTGPASPGMPQLRPLGPEVDGGGFWALLGRPAFLALSPLRG